MTSSSASRVRLRDCGCGCCCRLDCGCCCRSGCSLWRFQQSSVVWLSILQYVQFRVLSVPFPPRPPLPPRPRPPRPPRPLPPCAYKPVVDFESTTAAISSALNSSSASLSPASSASIVISGVRLRTVMIVLNFGGHVEYMCPRRFSSDIACDEP